MLRIRRILERRIMPSLILDPSGVIPSRSALSDREGQSDALVAMALQGREEQARSELKDMFDAGMPVEDLKIGLLAPAARKLGVLWESDSVSFVDVTIATGTLQRLMHFVALELDAPPLITDSARSILLFPEPGAEHTFGAAMAARLFERAGWRVDYVASADEVDLARRVAAQHYHVIGLSLNIREKAEACRALVERLRKASRNPEIVAIGGGAAIVKDPLLVEKAGLDAVATTIARVPADLRRHITPAAERGPDDG